MDRLRRLLHGLGSVVALLIGRPSRGLWRLVRRGARAEGAAESGLESLVYVHAVNGMGDYAVAIGLAGTLFFSVPVGEARSKVALYLLITMAPFVLLAPVVGPLLDRFPHGRRYAIATTMLVRAFLAYVISGSLHNIWLYPAAFGVLVSSKAYSVARSAVMPRLLPRQVTLVAANSRLSLASNLAGGVAAAVALGLAKLGSAWPMRLACVLFVVGMVLALRLPSKADSEHAPPAQHRRPLQTVLPRLRLGHRVGVALRPAAALRGLSGFLTLYLAFLLRTGGTGVAGGLALGAVAVGAGAGSFIGTAVGAKLRLSRPYPLQLALIVAAVAACTLAALRYDLITAVTVALVAGASNGLCKLCLDAVIQSRVGEETRASAFAASETLLQLTWVIGGAIGLVPFGGWPGFVVAAVLLGGVSVWTATGLRSVPTRRIAPSRSA